MCVYRGRREKEGKQRTQKAKNSKNKKQKKARSNPPLAYFISFALALALLD
jgi:hypothetical protein